MKQIPWIRKSLRIGWIILDEYDNIVKYLWDPYKKSKEWGDIL